MLRISEAWVRWPPASEGTDGAWAVRGGQAACPVSRPCFAWPAAFRS